MTQDVCGNGVYHESKVQQIDVTREVHRQDDADFDSSDCAKPNFKSITLAHCFKVPQCEPARLVNKNEGLNNH